MQSAEEGGKGNGVVVAAGASTTLASIPGGTGLTRGDDRLYIAATTAVYSYDVSTGPLRLCPLPGNVMLGCSCHPSGILVP